MGTVHDHGSLAATRDRHPSGTDALLAIHFAHDRTRVAVADVS
jgi:hypothetical protein